MAAKSPPAAHSTDRHLSRQILTHADAYVAEWDRRHAERRILTQYFAGGPRPHQLTYGMAHPKILVFHHDRRRGRILKGGNKSAKTVAGVVEDILWCAGQHPLRRTAPLPVRGRLVAPDLPLTLDRPHVQRDTVRDWCPPQWLRGGSFEEAYSITGHTLHFANSSILEFLSFSQDPQVHAGERLHFVHFDEEPPRPIWAENMARLARGLYLGEWWMTYVPVAGLAWIEQELYRPALEERGPFGLHEVTIWDNVHNLPAGFIETLQESFREDEQKVRLYGQYGIREGLVFDLFGADHVVEAGQFVVVRE